MVFSQKELRHGNHHVQHDDNIVVLKNNNLKSQVMWGYFIIVIGPTFYESCDDKDEDLLKMAWQKWS